MPGSGAPTRLANLLKNIDIDPVSGRGTPIAVMVWHGPRWGASRPERETVGLRAAHGS